jgi:hypothetical protein
MSAKRSTPQAIKMPPTIFVFLTLKAATIAPMFIAIIAIAISNAQPTKSAKIGIPIKLFIRKYKKSPINGITIPKIAVMMVSF